MTEEEARRLEYEEMRKSRPDLTYEEFKKEMGLDAELGRDGNLAGPDNPPREYKLDPNQGGLGAAVVKPDGASNQGGQNTAKPENAYPLLPDNSWMDIGKQEQKTEAIRQETGGITENREESYPLLVEAPVKLHDNGIEETSAKKTKETKKSDYPLRPDNSWMDIGKQEQKTEEIRREANAYRNEHEGENRMPMWGDSTEKKLVSETYSLPKEEKNSLLPAFSLELKDYSKNVLDDEQYRYYKRNVDSHIDKRMQELKELPEYQNLTVFGKAAAMSQMKKAAEAEFREMVRNGLTNDGERNIMKKSASELKNMSKIKPAPEPYINNPLNWENELHDNISRRVNEISPDLSEEERKLQIDPIVLEEAEKLQKKYRTVYTASDFGKGKYSALIPLYRDYPTKETERSPLGEMITGAIQNGFYSGLGVAASQGISGNSSTKNATMQRTDGKDSILGNAEKKIINSIDDIKYGQSSLDKAFSKHSGDFGTYPDGSNSSKILFQNDINQLIINGVHKSGSYRATLGTHVYNPSTRQWAFFNANGTFNTAFKLSPEQFKYLIETGVVK